jgi:MFS family permease
MGHRWNVRLISRIWSRFCVGSRVACVAMDGARAGRPHDFGFLLAAAAISQAGTQVSLIALPLVAVVFLHASTFQTGLLATAQNASFLLIGLPAGAWIDRLRRRPVLRLPATMYGLLLAVGAAGGLAGALCASRVIQRFGASRVVRLMLATTTSVMLVMPLSEAGWRLALYPAGAFVSWSGSAVFNVAQLTLRQRVCPEEMRGRVNVTMRFVMWGSMPLGGFVGGGLGQLLGVRPALWFCALGSTAATVPLLTMRGAAPTMAG